VLYDQLDPQTHYRTDEFVFGNQILVCPVQEPNAKGRRLYIPRGNWYNYWTRDYVKGGLEQWVDADLDTIPLFIKEGAIIPKYPIQQYVGEKKIEELKLEVYYKLGNKEESKVAVLALEVLLLQEKRMRLLFNNIRVVPTLLNMNT